MERNKKKSAKGKVIVGGAILLALFCGAFGLGFGKGGGFGLLNKAETSVTQTEAVQAEETQTPVAPETTPVDETEAAERQQILVNENTISFAGETVTLDVLRDKLLSAYDGATPWELIDEHAIKADYDAVKSLLDELGMAYIEM